LLADGTVMAWGWNEWGQLGDGTSGNFRIKPAAVPGLTGVKAIAAGFADSYALLQNGTVMSWGLNQNGELGNGTFSQHEDVPGPVSRLEGVTAISSTSEHVLALLNDGTVKAWGSDRYSALGDGGTKDEKRPITVAGLAGVRSISAGADFSLVVLQDHTVKAWGQDNWGQIGAEKGSATDVPVLVKFLRNVVAVSAGETSSFAVLSDGTARAWGSNDDGELGNGGRHAAAAHPIVVRGLSGVTALAAGGAFALALN
jgi:alpha-tubulin suppressor-like RCC1 family protein